MRPDRFEIITVDDSLLSDLDAEILAKPDTTDFSKRKIRRGMIVLNNEGLWDAYKDFQKENKDSPEAKQLEYLLENLGEAHEERYDSEVSRRNYDRILNSYKNVLEED